MWKRIVREHGGESFHSPVGSQDAERSASYGEKDGFCEQLADQAAASGAHRSAYGELVLASRSASKQEDRNVGAADKEKHYDGAEQKDDSSRKATQDLFIQRDNLDAHVLRITLGIFFGEAVHQDLHLGLSRRIFCARLQLDEG